MKENEFAFDSRLDTNFLNILYKGDRGHAALIFEQFLKGMPGHLKDADDNFASGNTELFRRKVHMMKPVFSFVGLTWLTGKAEILEKKCNQISMITEITDLYTDFRNNIVEFTPVIETELSKLKE